MKINRGNKRWVFVLAVVVLSVLVSGCSGKGTDSDSNSASDSASTETSASTSASGNDQQATVTMWGWDKAYAEKTVEGFNKVYPNIKVEFVDVSAGDYLKKLQTSVAAGSDLPDIIWGEAGFRGALFALNILDDLTKEPYSFDKSKLIDQVIPQLQNEKGELVGLEQSVNPGALAYKRNLAKQYFGTDDPDQLAAMFPDWNSFIEKGKEVKQKSGGKVSMLPGMMDAYTVVYPQYPEAFIHGEQIDTSAVKSIFQTLENIRNADITAKLDMWSPTWNASYAKDDVIFYPAANWSPHFVIEPNDKGSTGRWGLMVPPGGGYSYGGTSLGIWKDSKNKEAAWKYLEWTLASEEGVKLSKEAFDYYVPLKSVFGNSAAFAAGPNPYYGGQDLGLFWVDKVLPTMKTRPYSKYDQDIYNASSINMQTMTKDLKYGTETAVSNWQKELKKNHPEIEFK